jgi:hypothetical protein
MLVYEYRSFYASAVMRRECYAMRLREGVQDNGIVITSPCYVESIFI